MAGIREMKMRIIMKFKTMTSVDGVEPRNRAANTIENKTMYIIASDAITITYENTRNQIDERLSIL